MRLDLVQQWAAAVTPVEGVEAFVALTRMYTPDELADELARGILRYAQLANACHVRLGPAVAQLLTQEALWPVETL